MGIVPWHQVGSPEGVAEFVNSFVYGSSHLANVHEEFFTRGTNAVETGFFGDFSELFLCYSEWYLWGPGEGGPGV